MSHKTSSKHGFSIWKRLHAESSALTVHERARSPRTTLPDTRKSKLAFNWCAAHSREAQTETAAETTARLQLCDDLKPHANRC